MRAPLKTTLASWAPSINIIIIIIIITWTDPYQNDSQFTTWLSYNLLYHARRNTNKGHKPTLAMNLWSLSCGNDVL